MIKRSRFWAIFVALAVIFVAYGQTLRMYFWQDDSALIFKLQNPEGAAGSFGYGIIGQGAYKYLVTPFVPFFPIFGLEPFGYFAIGLITYLLATGAFYLFARELFGALKTAQGKRAAFFATLIFAAGYVGSDIMFRIINSWQANIGLTLALLTFWMFIRFLREGGLGKYLASLALFLATIELVFIRSHSLILPILAIDVLLRTVAPKVKELPKFVIRQIPFWFLWQRFYLSDPEFGGPGIKNLLESLLKGEFVVLSPVFANIGNGLVPDVLQTKFISLLRLEVFGASVLLTLSSLALVWILGKIYKASLKAKLIAAVSVVLAFILNQSFYEASPLWYRDAQSVVAGLLGMQALILVFYASYLLWPRNKTFAIAFPFGLIFLASQIFGYYTQYPTAVFHTTHRYFSYSFVGYSIIFGVITYLLSASRLLKVAPLLLLVGFNLFLGARYQARLVEERSLPTRGFYQDLKTFVPSIEKGATFYFDVAAEPFYQRQFGDFFSVGSMPESTALAIYYGVDRYDLKMLTNFDELVFKLSEGEINVDNTYAFFYGRQGLVDTTEKTRELIKNGSVFTDVSRVSPLTPLLLRVEASVSQDAVPDFPYQHPGGGGDYSPEEKLAMLDYLKNRKEYYRDVSASSLSEWKFREVRNVVDNDSTTPWQGHRIWWHENKNEYLTVDLGKVKEVSRVVWQNWQPTLTPTSYTIESSTDGKTWQELRGAVDGPERKGREYVVEEFMPTNARFVRMDITKTLTDDSPAILEFEVVEAKYKDVNPQQALEFFKNPFAYVEDEKEWNWLYTGLENLAEAAVSWETDKKDVYSNSTVVPIYLDGRMHSYEVVVPAGGTKLGEVKFNLNFPARVTVGRIVVRNLSLKELEDRGLIKAISEN